MRDPFEVMPRETAMMFRFLETIPSLNDFVLIGGTALALHLGHRTNEDLNFITTLPRPGIMCTPRLRRLTNQREINR